MAKKISTGSSTPKCKPDEAPDLQVITNVHSDAKTPAEQVEQILQIAAILPGQTLTRKFSIPSRSGTTNTKRLPPTQQIASEDVQSQPELTPQKGQTTDDLIDLSEPAVPAQTSKPVAAAVTTTADNHHDDAVAPTPVPSEKPKSASPQPDNREDKNHAFADQLPPSKLLNSVQGEPGRGSALRRYDSETQEEDEFHDAVS